MGRLRERIQASEESGMNETDLKYDLAYKKVKRIKGFYTHLVIYILVNSFIILSTYNQAFIADENFWEWSNFNTMIFWGIGLLAHGLSVFGRNLFFGSDWEEQKIKEIMEKDKGTKWE